MDGKERAKEKAVNTYGLVSANFYNPREFQSTKEQLKSRINMHGRIQNVCNNEDSVEGHEFAN